MTTILGIRGLSCHHLLAAVWIAGLSLGMAAPLAAETRASDAPKIRDTTFDDIKLDLKKGEAFQRSKLTEKVEKLHGTTIRLRGYMYPSYQQNGIKEFVLVRDNMECCFGPMAALHDCVRVAMAEGKSASYTIRPVSVVGKFEISEFKDPDGRVLAIYLITGEEVK